MSTKTENRQHNLKRMYWHSRRGMLELDLILVPFAMEQLSTLDDSMQEKYRLLLEQEDQDLFLWLTRRNDAPEPHLRDIIKVILEARIPVNSSFCRDYR